MRKYDLINWAVNSQNHIQTYFWGVIEFLLLESPQNGQYIFKILPEWQEVLCRGKVDRKQIFYSDFHFLPSAALLRKWHGLLLALSVHLEYKILPPVYSESGFLFLSPIHLPSPLHLCFLWWWCCVCPSPSLQQSSSKQCGRWGCRQGWCLREAGHWLSTGTGKIQHRR